MLWLPPLMVSDDAWWLPLSPGGERRLAIALCMQGASRRERFEQLLAIEPPLALWALCHAPAEVQEAATLPLLAEWLARAVCEQFAAEPTAPRPASSIDEEIAGALARSNVRLAEAARAVSAAGQGESAYVAGLLADARAWFQASEDAPQVCPSVPGWLTGIWNQGVAGNTAQAANVEHHADDRSALVQRARGILANPAERPPELSHAEEAAGLWSSGGGQEDSLLAAVARRVARQGEESSSFQTALEQAKLEAMKELAYGASHEINNPLANISARAQMLLKEEEDPERRRKLAAINTQAFRAHEMIADLMLFARPPQLRPVEANLVELIHGVLADLRSEAEQRGIELRWQPTPASVATLDPAQIKMALRALVLNAIEAVGRAGWVEVQLRSPLGGSAGVEIVVRDNGPGVSDEVRGRIFDPFYSGREAGRGLGFGLSKCWRIATAHGGDVTVETQPGAGSTFVLSLPAKPSDAPEPSTSGANAHAG